MSSNALLQSSKDLEASPLRPPPTLALQKRDLKALKWVLEQGIMTFTQFWKACWPENQWGSYTRRRIRLFEKHGCLKSLPHPYYSYRIYLGTPQTGECVRASSLEEAGFLPPPETITHTSELRHTLRLTDLRIALEQSGKVKNFESERVLRALIPKSQGSGLWDRDRFPDALWYSVNGGKAYLELELSLKSEPRLLRKMKDYHARITQGALQRVLWLVEEDSVYSRVEKALKGFPHQKLYYISEFLQKLQKQG